MEIADKNSFVFDFENMHKTNPGIVGGKGANLGVLYRIKGIHVPDGFCISTEAFKMTIRGSPEINKLLDQLSLLKAKDQDRISQLSSEIRKVIEKAAVPPEIREEISRHLSELGEKNAYAIRSSATAEDLPTASFAGQQDTFLNITGKKPILKYIRRCWASLFTGRAVTYRFQNGFDHHTVSLSVIVQKMVFPQVSGIMFTADPVTSNRTILSIDASFGLGETLVSGSVNADNYKVKNGMITDKKISTKKLAAIATNEGGTKLVEIEPEQRNEQALGDKQVLEFERTGRKIESHFGCPQDIEWCLADGTFYILQSRPITTLYPVPESRDEENHVYISVGHQQMMTDPMRPLGISIWQLIAGRPMYKAGGRLFVDVTAELSSPAGREMLLNTMGQHDPLIKDAITTIIERDNFIALLPDDANKAVPGNNNLAMPKPIEKDPAIVDELIEQSQASLNTLKQNILTKSGPEVIDFILEDILQLKTLTDPRSRDVIMTAINASFWINEKMNAWLDEKNVADALTQSAPNNITSEMGLALLDLADVLRPYPQVIKYLQQEKENPSLDRLDRLEGGKEVRSAINNFLSNYGMRCAGEIDITNRRWSEKPATLIPVILRHIKNFESGESKRKFEQGLKEAHHKEQELLERLKKLPDGEQKVRETKQKIDQLRNFSGYREYPKYGIVNRLFVYKQAILKEAERLQQAGVIQEKEDIYYLRFEELHEVLRMHELDPGIIIQRKEEHRYFERLTPPRVITSEGEIVTGQYKRENLPADAIVGLPVSSGIIEGRARVILNMKDAYLQKEDILVTTFTDPSWTPLFVSISGLVTEVGGMMTHGAVIAREYGLPAVVGVENATKLIKDGQKIRVNGTEGYIEIL